MKRCKILFRISFCINIYWCSHWWVHQDYHETTVRGIHKNLGFCKERHYLKLKRWFSRINVIALGFPKVNDKNIWMIIISKSSFRTFKELCGTLIILSNLSHYQWSHSVACLFRRRYTHLMWSLLDRGKSEIII
jgi:hypothetical protein